MHDAHQLIALVHNRHRHDSVVLHAVKYSARELTGAGELGASRHDAPHWYRPQVVAVLDEATEVPCGQYPVDVSSCVDDDCNATTLRNHDDCLPHRVSIAQYRKLLAEHDLFNLDHESQRAAGVQASEVLALKPLFLQENDGERVAEGERGRSARGWGEIVRTCFFANRGVEDDVAIARQRRVDVAGYRDCPDAESLQIAKQSKQLGGLAALGDENRDVLVTDDAKITV